MSSKSKNNNILLNKKIKQLQKQLELSKKTAKKLRRDKNSLSKKIDTLISEKSKLETQLNQKNHDIKKQQKEFETSKRHEIWKLRHELYSTRNHDQNVAATENNNETDNIYILQQIDFKDPEIDHVFRKIYQIENSVQKSLDTISNKYNKSTQAGECLDNSFETISLLLQESKAQKKIINELNAKIKLLTNEHEINSQLNEQLIEKNEIIKELQEENGKSNILDKNMLNKLQKSNIEYQSEIHSLCIEIETLKYNNTQQKGEIELFENKVQHLQKMLQATKQRNELLIKRVESIQYERNQLVKRLKVS